MGKTTTYVVQARDAEGRDLYPGLTIDGTLVPIGKPIPSDVPARSIKQLAAQGVIAPAGKDPED